MHRPPLLLLLFAGTLIGSLAIAQPYIVADQPTRFDDPIVAGPAPVAEQPAPQVVEVDKLPAAPASELAGTPPMVQTAPPVVRAAPACGERPARRHAEVHLELRGDAAALAAREILSWGVMDDLLEARGARGLPVPLGDAPLKDRAVPGLPCAVTLQ